MNAEGRHAQPRSQQFARASRRGNEHGFQGVQRAFRGAERAFGFAPNEHGARRFRGEHEFRPFFFTRPYYAFRRHFSLGLGLWLGYPVPYPDYFYGYPYGYEYSVPPNAIEVVPGQPYGGLSFEVTPPDAAIYVDGQYAGVASDYTPNAQPLAVGTGEHVIELQAPGYRTMVFNLDVTAGQVMPVQGAMQPD